MAVLAVVATRTTEGFAPPTTGLISNGALPLYAEKSQAEDTSAFIPPPSDANVENTEEDDGKYLSTVEMFGKGAAKVCVGCSDDFGPSLYHAA